MEEPKTAVVEISTPYLVQCTWDEAPHLDERAKAELLAGMPMYQRDARSKGVPQLGAGAVYPIPEEDILVDPFEIPPYWKRAYALDVGWNRTAALWGALDPNTNILYLYREHYRGRATPAEHARAIRQAGAWIPGVIDPASSGSSQHDGQRIIDLYQREGLDLSFADNDVEAGIYDVTQRLQAGTLKVFKTLMNYRQEYRLYRRDPKGTGKIVKPNLPQELPEGKTAAQFGDHLQDCCRYICRSALAIMKAEPNSPKAAQIVDPNWTPRTGPLAWMS
jgi:hypothetical protein